MMRISIKGMKILCLGLLVCLCLSCDDYLNGVDGMVVDELNRLSVRPTDYAEISRVRLPEDLMTSSQYAPVVGVCLEGGYHLFRYAGQTLTRTAVVIEGNCSDYPIKIQVFSTDEKVACAYLIVADPTIPIAPGVWSVTNQNCTYEDPTNGCDG